MRLAPAVVALGNTAGAGQFQAAQAIGRVAEVFCGVVRGVGDRFEVAVGVVGSAVGEGEYALAGHFVFVA